MRSPAVSAGGVDGDAASVLGATVATVATEGSVVVVVDVGVVVAVVELTGGVVSVGVAVAVVGVVATGREGGDP